MRSVFIADRERVEAAIDLWGMMPRFMLRSRGIDPCRPVTVWRDPVKDGMWVKGYETAAS